MDRIILEGDVREYSDYDWYYVTVGGQSVANAVIDMARDMKWKHWVYVPAQYAGHDGATESDNEYGTPVGLKVRVTIEVIATE